MAGISPKSPGLRIARLRAIANGDVGWYDSPRIDGIKIDRTTASAIVTVYDALSEANREKYLQMDVRVMADFAWKQVRITGFTSTPASRRRAIPPGEWGLSRRRRGGWL